MSTSTRNHLPGTIEQIISDKVVSEIVINTAAGLIVSIITTGSVKRMNLKKGRRRFRHNQSDRGFDRKRIIIAFLTLLSRPGCCDAKGLTSRCSRRLAGLFPPALMIRIRSETARRALIRILPMLTRSGFPSMSHRFPLAPFTSRG